MRCLKYTLIGALLASPVLALAEQLWVISENPAAANLVDVDSISEHGDTRSATIYQVFNMIQNIAGAPTRAVKVEVTYDCAAMTRRQDSAFSLDDAMNEIGDLGSAAEATVPPGSDAATGMDFLCADEAARASMGSKIEGDATLEAAFAHARSMGA
jgi:hypothetical protein